VILEHALLSIRPGSEAAFEAAFADAREVVARAPGYRSLSLWRGMEEPATYRLLIGWDSVADHTEGFRGSELYARWSELLRPHFAEPPVVHHAAPIANDHEGA
jgi:heme-degrading monooxygenase HmoA